MAAIVDASVVVREADADVGQMLGRLGIEVRCGDLFGRPIMQPDGLWVRPDAFLGGEAPREGMVVDVHWRVGAARYVGWAPVIERGVRAGLLLGAIKKTRRVGTVRELDWNLFHVDCKPGLPSSATYRIRYADPEWLRVTVTPETITLPNDIWWGRLRKGEQTFDVAAQVRGGHRWAIDGTRVVVLRWRPEAG